MAQITRARVSELMWALMRLLDEAPDGLAAKDALAALRQAVPETEWESGTFPSGGNRYDKVVRYSTIDLTKSGWLAKDHGTWRITDEGRASMDAIPDPVAWYTEAVNKYRAWAKANRKDKKAAVHDVVEGDDADEEIAEDSIVAVEEAREVAEETIRKYLSVMAWHDFQRLVAHLLRGMGYHVDTEAPPGRDGGIDIIAFSDPLGADGSPRIKVQVKRHASTTDADTIHAFMNRLGSRDMGLFVNLGGFTKDARLAVQNSDKRCVLIDFARLLELWTDNLASIPEEGTRLLPLTPVFYLALD